jgi:HEPN domain-containing protein
MASPLEYATLLISKARDDKFALDVLLENLKVADEIIGFHAQQIIEKTIKSVLALKSIRYRKSHDLAELIDLLKDNGIQIPSFLENAVNLTPFAVEFRYDFLPPENENSERINRAEINELAQNAIDWASSILSDNKG